MELKEIVESRDYKKMVGFPDHPMPGKYYITGLIAGRSDPSWMVGYVVQVRRRAGAYKSDMVIMRHPCGGLVQHSNQSFYEMTDHLVEQVKAHYPDGSGYGGDYDGPDVEYTLGNNEFPETGPVIEYKGQLVENPSPMMQITIDHGDGSETVEVV